MLTSRKPATTRNPSWASRGVEGALSPSSSTPMHQAPKNSHEPTLIVCGSKVNGSPVCSIACCTTSHTDPRSAPRSELNVQKTFHSDGPERYAGRLARIHAPAAPRAASPSS